MTYPSEGQRQAIQAFLGGFYETATVVPLADAQAIVSKHFPDTVPVDGMMVSRMLRRLGFAKTYDAAAPTYRRVVRLEEVPY